ncbi:MAG TPA: glycosyltransferase family 2 protein [Methanocella sp.]|uniref:glycosyltransferase family 2 protein n=1 Tax=Methanocella sp. TaxID=2052833 RepID=UPI002BEF898C|nr:glycosyltransferase family 2 protein [Methanocella sp.]HTY91609.1 glycosyltransferase family 2 protein [Methanocella sp.]
MEPAVFIILLNWNGKEDTLACLGSLQRLDYPSYRILVADNGSMDGSVEAIRSAFPGVRVVENGANLGFAGGNNIAIRQALQDGADYVLLLNNDTEADPGFLSRLVEAAESDPNIGIAGSKIYYYSEPKRLWYAGGSVNLWKGDTHHIGENQLDGGQYDEAKDTDYVSGCAMLIKRQVIEDIGLLDERMFLYYEDSDYCMRARQQGYRVVYIPSSIVWHKVSGTTGKIKDLQLFYGTRNMLLFEKRNAGLPKLLVFLPYYFGKFIAYNAVVALVQGQTARARVILKAAYEGLVR